MHVYARYERSETFPETGVATSRREDSDRDGGRTARVLRSPAICDCRRHCHITLSDSLFHHGHDWKRRATLAVNQGRTKRQHIRLGLRAREPGTQLLDERLGTALPVTGRKAL